MCSSLAVVEQENDRGSIEHLCVPQHATQCTSAASMLWHGMWSYAPIPSTLSTVVRGSGWNKFHRHRSVLVNKRHCTAFHRVYLYGGSSSRGRCGISWTVGFATWRLAEAFEAALRTHFVEQATFRNGAQSGTGKK